MIEISYIEWPYKALEFIHDIHVNINTISNK